MTWFRLCNPVTRTLPAMLISLPSHCEKFHPIVSPNSCETSLNRKKTWHLHTITTIDLLLTFSLTVKPLGSGAFGQVFLAHAVGIVAFDPRGSTKRKSGRRRSRFGSTSRPYVNDKRVTAVAVKSLKGNFIILYLQRNTERLLIRSQC